jgi:hypothetical protein
MLFLVALAILASRIIVVDKIVCQSQYGTCDPTLERGLRRAEGLSLHLARKSLASTLSESPLVSDYSIRFILPAGYEVHFVERKAKFALIDSRTEKMILLDKEGRVISTVNSTNLPRVVINENVPTINEIVGRDLLFALNLMFDVYLSYQVQEGFVEAGSLVVDLDRGIEVIFPLSGDRKVLVGSLSIILNQLNSLRKDSTIGDIDVTSKTIDLRYKNPIIR